MGKMDPRRCLTVQAFPLSLCAKFGDPDAPSCPCQSCKLPGGQTLDLATFLELQSALEEELRSREMLCQELSVVKVANQTFAR